MVTRVGAVVALVVIGLVPSAAMAQAPRSGAAPATQKRVQAVRIPNGRITVDGKIDEAEWQQAVPASDFIQMQPREGAPVTSQHTSEVRFLYDDNNLYIGGTLHEDEMPRVITGDLRRDFPGARDGDLYIVNLDTFYDKLNAYNFQTNPGCAQRDSQSYDDGRTVNANWDTVWQCRSSKGDGAWYVEIGVPFKQMRFPRADEQVWGMNIFRLIRHTNEQTAWNPIPRQFNQFKSSYEGVLEGIKGVNPGRNIRIKPFVTGQTRKVGTTRTNDGDGGLDVKIGLGTNLVLDGTWRTDFSQVEADTQQVNLTRFSLFFPEKREFFLENQGAFQIGPAQGFGNQSTNFVPFFSRTIGLSETGTPIPIVGGLRVSGRVGRSTIGMLNMQTEREERPGLVALPASNVTVMRVNRNLRSQSSAGAFFMDKERGSVSNRLFGGEARLSPTRALTVDGLVMASEKTGIDAGAAWRAGVQYDPSVMSYGLSFTSLGKSFKDDLGFVPREGVDILSGSVLRRIRPKATAAVVREFGASVGYNRFSKGGIGTETATLGPALSVEFNDASRVTFSALRNEERLSAPFRPQGIPAGRSIPVGRYTFENGEVTYQGSNAKRLSPVGGLRFGAFYDGSRQGWTAGARVRSSEKLAATLTITRDTVDVPAATFDTTLVSLRIDGSFSTRMFANAYVQYNSVARQIVSNVRYDFIHHPLSDLFLVYNETRATGGSTAPPSRSFVLKFTQLLSF